VNFNKLKKSKLFILIAIVLFLIIVPFLIWGNDITDWFMSQYWFEKNSKLASADRGIAAIVMFGLLASDIVLPIPSSLVSTCCGLFLGFFDGFIISFLGMTVSAVLGYLIGRFFSGYAKRLVGEREMLSLGRFHKQNRFWWILMLRPVPVLAEASVLLGGIGRMSFKQVALEFTIGNIAVSAVYAAIGAFIGKSESILYAFAATLIISALSMLIARKELNR
jgi:uncharacterized membrane protein YdjX (TVP38/TMEM64 family)